MPERLRYRRYSLGTENTVGWGAVVEAQCPLWSRCATVRFRGIVTIYACHGYPPKRVGLVEILICRHG